MLLHAAAAVHANFYSATSSPLPTDHRISEIIKKKMRTTCVCVCTWVPLAYSCVYCVCMYLALATAQKNNFGTNHQSQQSLAVMRSYYHIIINFVN